jgi:hypothetical protein
MYRVDQTTTDFLQMLHHLEQTLLIAVGASGKSMQDFRMVGKQSAFIGMRSILHKGKNESALTVPFNDGGCPSIKALQNNGNITA